MLGAGQEAVGGLGAVELGQGVAGSGAERQVEHRPGPEQLGGDVEVAAGQRGTEQGLRVVGDRAGRAGVARRQQAAVGGVQHGVGQGVGVGQLAVQQVGAALEHRAGRHVGGGAALGQPLQPRQLEAVEGVGLVAEVVAGEVEQVPGDRPVAGVEVAEQGEREGLAGAAPRVGGDGQRGAVGVERPGERLAEAGLRGAEPLEARQRRVVGEQPPGDPAEQGGLAEHLRRHQGAGAADAGPALARRDDAGRAQPEAVREPASQLVRSAHPTGPSSRRRTGAAPGPASRS